MTNLLPADDKTIRQAAALIRAGELVAFPTETVYGLGANAFDAQAVARIFAAKGRPASDPVIVHVASRAQLAEVTPHMPPLGARLIDAFWPGPLTLVLPRGPRIPSDVSAGLPTVAVRMPAHPVALALIEAAGVPIAAPSANLFGHASPTTAQHVLDDLAGRVALILDGGPTPVGVESSILDLSGERPRLLRPGGVPLEAILHYAPEVEVVNRLVRLEELERNGEAGLPAPGMLARHYSPRAEMIVFEGEDGAVRGALAEAASGLVAEGRAVGLLVAEEDRVALARLGVPIVMLGALADLEQIARNLFAGLRELDEHGVQVILARAYPPVGLGLAIRDRLIRAAEGRLRRV